MRSFVPSVRGCARIFDQLYSMRQEKLGMFVKQMRVLYCYSEFDGSKPYCLFIFYFGEGIAWIFLNGVS